MDRIPYIIIGNSVAAVSAVEGIREVDAEGPITIVAKEPHHCYSRPLISYWLAGKLDDRRMSYRNPDFYETNNVRAILGVEAKRIDPEKRTVELSDGRSLPFEKLLIATGSRPILLPEVMDAKLRGVFTFSGWDDARAIRDFMEHNCVRRAVVVGGGLIGIKSVEALVASGVKATIVELAGHLLSGTFDTTASALAQQRLEKTGVQVRCGTTIARLTGQDGKVTGAVLRDGEEIPCDIVILAVGVIPNTGVAEGTGIRVDRGILVDNFMQTSVSGIYAAGDVAQAMDTLSGTRRPMPIFPNAFRQGLIAGRNMAGLRQSYAGGVNMNSIDIMGLPTISVGIAEAQGDGYEVLRVLDKDKPAYRKIILKGDRIVGAVFVGEIDRAGIVTGLIREGVGVAGFKELLLSEEFGVISLPANYRKHLVSGPGVEV